MSAQNSTCNPGSNSTDCFPTSGSSVGIAVGLPIFFVVLLLVVIAALLWFRSRKSVSNFEISNKLSSQNKSHEGHSRESPYSGYAGGLQPAPQSPIYENFQRGQSNPHEIQSSAVQSKDTHRPDQAYMEYDSHDAIYSNDPALFHPDQTEISEDVYIMPDA